MNILSKFSIIVTIFYNFAVNLKGNIILKGTVQTKMINTNKN